ncbi:hypothetical protein AMS68_007372 [Peltaster fructicola]|uniref:VPS9 domain-containing protein n=1 Tax=Peltaster fructicola TaxID=286661 RepID=A0A6H0Y4K2_9PEZI|nr:hypothetical protein AMS68_007372 [Peltaster fructicola]
MPPFNPFLRALFRSNLPAQCQPIAEYILLVPTTEILLFSKDSDTNSPYHECCQTEDFLACHVLHAHPLPTGDTSHAGGSVRETKTKPKQYATVNGKSVIVKDNFIYSNKGFRTLNQAQILQDAIFYPDALDGQQWLIYYISRPLVGSFKATPIIPAILSDEPSRERRVVLAEATAEVAGIPPSPSPRKKEIKNFSELLSHFPMISRQMQNGLEDALRSFIAANDKVIVKQQSRRSSVSSQRSGVSISESISSIKSSLSGSTTIHPTALELEPDEERMRVGLESTVNTAIELFQSVDKTQLSLLGANTKLTGPMVERMIERYVMEQLHDQTVFARICAFRRSEDADLESKLRRMCDIDIAQVGIPFDDGMRGKRALASRLKKGIDAFVKMGTSSSPQEMLEILLATQKAITIGSDEASEKLPLINADILVSMLLIVVIRSNVRHLHSRLLYMRYFIFIDEVDTGEQGYALATLEAVLMHLSSDAKALRRASTRNRALWQATKEGDVKTLKTIMDVKLSSMPEDTESSDGTEAPRPMFEFDVSNGNLGVPSGSLDHVFPFQKPPTPSRASCREVKRKKRVSLAPRSQSQSSFRSSPAHSRTMSMDSNTASVTDDVSVDKLAQTQDSEGNSILMMAVEMKQLVSLQFLLSQTTHLDLDFVLGDTNDEHTTLLSAAVQSGDMRLTDELIYHIEELATTQQIEDYLAIQDTNGRCVAHYLFTQPHLIAHFGGRLPWRLKDKNGQTPLFALCRSYDNDQYKSMVQTALRLTTEQQGDGQPLHLDDHIDAKGNTLLHIVHEPRIVSRLLRYCDSDVNAANDKKFTPIMVASKYGKIDLVRVLYGDPRADITLREYRGLSALELAKDDDVRNQIDDLVLLSSNNRKNDRTTTIVRSFFVEDSTVRLVVKSGAHNPDGSVTISTCRRSLADFENLASWLNTECPASWLPSNFNLPSPFAIPARPSRAVLRDTQLRLNAFFQALLTHTTFATHEMVWEFFLMPELDAPMLSERSRRKAEARVDNLHEDYEPVTDTTEIENFVGSAKEQIRKLSQATRKVIRAINQQRMRHNDFSEATLLTASAVGTLLFVPQTHLHALERYAKLTAPTDAAPLNAIYYTFRCTLTSALAIQNSLNRPALLIGSMAQSERAISRTKNSLSRANRWTPNIALFDDTKRAVAADAWQKEAKARRELETLGCELRYTMVTVASELAGWQEQRAIDGRKVLRNFAQAMVVKERAKLEGMRRALRQVQKV